MDVQDGDNSALDEFSLDDFDLSAIAGVDDKYEECQFFLSLAEIEQDRNRFRWLMSAFCSAAYSYFETHALSACVTDESQGDARADPELLALVREHIGVDYFEKDPSRPRTFG